MTYLANDEFYFQVARGRRSGHTSIRKYGRNSDIDTASGFETIWEGWTPATTWLSRKL